MSKKTARYQCLNCEAGNMRVYKTQTMTSTVIRWRLCRACGHILKTRETLVTEAPETETPRKVVSFSEMQKQAMERHRNRKK